MSIKVKTILRISLVLFSCGVLFVYIRYFWHYPRSYRYEAKMLEAIENVQKNGDTLATFRLDSVMDFQWYKVVYVGPYLDVSEQTSKCGIDFSILQNSDLNTDDRFNALLFLDDQNQPVKFLQFEGLIYSFQEMNKIYPCGTTKQHALFQLWKFKNDQFFRFQLIQ